MWFCAWRPYLISFKTPTTNVHEILMLCVIIWAQKYWNKNIMREIVHCQLGQCGNQIGNKARLSLRFTALVLPISSTFYYRTGIFVRWQSTKKTTNIPQLSASPSSHSRTQNIEAQTQCTAASLKFIHQDWFGAIGILTIVLHEWTPNYCTTPGFTGYRQLWY